MPIACGQPVSHRFSPAATCGRFVAMRTALPLALLFLLEACGPPPPEGSPPAPAAQRPPPRPQPLQRPVSPPPPEPLRRPTAPTIIPAGALRFPVRSVYDGDTLTLSNDRRVRLLGVDTPELKEKENLAEEARDFTRRLCEGREVWLEFDLEKEDRYQRWLCYVYARDDAGERMVNAELLRAGLARFYTPGPSNLRHAEMLLACQREAREAGRGTWKDYVFAAEKKVVATPNGRAFHRPTCESIRTSKSLRTLTEKEALDAGLSPCRGCKP